MSAGLLTESFFTKVKNPVKFSAFSLGKSIISNEKGPQIFSQEIQTTPPFLLEKYSLKPLDFPRPFHLAVNPLRNSSWSICWRGFLGYFPHFLKNPLIFQNIFLTYWFPHYAIFYLGFVHWK